SKGYIRNDHALKRLHDTGRRRGAKTPRTVYSLTKAQPELYGFVRRGTERTRSAIRQHTAAGCECRVGWIVIHHGEILRAVRTDSTPPSQPNKNFNASQAQNRLPKRRVKQYIRLERSVHRSIELEKNQGQRLY